MTVVDTLQLSAAIFGHVSETTGISVASAAVTRRPVANSDGNFTSSALL